MLEDLGMGDILKGSAVSVFTDSQAALKMVCNPQTASRTSHVRKHYHYVKQEASENLIRISFVPGTEQVADGLTKCLGREAFRGFVKQMKMETVIAPPSRLASEGEL
jgi:hypothetical protein